MVQQVWSNKDVVRLLNRVQKGMRSRASRLMRQVHKRPDGSSVLLGRAQTWEEACYILEKEMEALRERK